MLTYRTITDRPDTAVTHCFVLKPAWRRISLMAKIVSFWEPILVDANPVSATSTALISLDPTSSAMSFLFLKAIYRFAPGCSEGTSPLRVPRCSRPRLGEGIDPCASRPQTPFRAGRLLEPLGRCTPSRP